MGGEEWNPGKILKVSGGYWETFALHAAVKLDLFTLLGDDSLDRDEVAGRLGADPRGVSMLLDALTAMGLIERNGRKYANRPPARSFLAKDAEQYLGHMILHHHHLVEPWARLDQAVRSGMPIRDRLSFALEEFMESFLLGMHAMAIQLAPRIVEVVDLSAKTRLLDLGGGPGTYAVHFCLRNPQIQATVFDLPTSQEPAEKTIQKFGLGDRIDFRGGNYLEDPLPTGFDAAWLSHILHGESPEGCRLILGKAVSALQPGGSLVVHEFIRDDHSAGPLFPALFALNMLIATEGGQTYSEQELRDMLEEAGVKDVQRLPFRGPNDSGLMSGRL